ncbi:hypothetical protein [Roseiflexus sp.]
MTTFKIGSIEFTISPVSIMQCFIKANWRAKGSKKSIQEFRVFAGHFFPFLFSQDTEMDIEEFCDASTNKIDEILQSQELQTDLITRFAKLLKGRMAPDNQQQAIQLAQEYEKKLEAWLSPPWNALGEKATQLLSTWGLPPPYRGLGAIGSFGNAIFGQYVPDLRAVCVQLDVVAARSAHPEIKFLETLLHEEVHAAIHCGMGDAGDRLELTWLNELCAVLTSQHALQVAGQQVLAPPGNNQLEQAIRLIRSNQEYGDLADAVLKETGDPLLGLKAWKRIFELKDPEKHNYAKNNIITPILRNLGWQVTFPFYYYYGATYKKYVTVFV